MHAGVWALVGDEAGDQSSGMASRAGGSACLVKSCISSSGSCNMSWTM